MTRNHRAGSVLGMTLLSGSEIDEALDSLPGWGGNADDIRCRYAAADFPGAIALVDSVAVAAEAAGHHPDIDIRYNEVLFVLSTHSEKGVTHNDIDLAKTIDGLARAAGLTPAGE